MTMQLTIPKKTFLRVLARAVGVVDRKSSMPILANLLLAAKDGVLGVAGTDLYLGVAASAPAEVRVAGSVAVAAKTLFDIVKNLPEGEVAVVVSPNYGVELKCGKARFRIPGMAGDDFPPLPAPGDATFVSIDGPTLATLIARTAYSMSDDDTRPHLAGALFELDLGTARMVTTDGHRLSKAEAKVEAKGALSMLVPNKGIGELRRMLDDAKGEAVEVATDGRIAFFRREGLVLSVKLADEAFPPYAKVIPASHTKRLVCHRPGLVDALRRVSLVASAKGTRSVRLALSAGSMRISSESPELGDGAEDLDVDYAGEALTIGFDARYLLDAVGCLEDDEVALELGGELDPGVIKTVSTDDFVGVVMPMRT